MRGSQDSRGTSMVEKKASSQKRLLQEEDEEAHVAHSKAGKSEAERQVK